MSDDQQPAGPPQPASATPTGAWGRLRARLEKHEFARHVLTLVSGTAFAQVLQLVSMLFVGRLFTPTEFGIYTLVMSAVAAITPIAAARYDLAVVLPRRDNDARQLIRLCTWINTGVAILVTLAMVGVAPWLGEVMSRGKDDAATVRHGLGLWLYAVGPVAWLVAQLGIMSYWLTRTKNFKQVAQNKMHQAVSVAVFQIGTGLAGFGVAGLVIATVAGNLASLTNLLRHTRGQYVIEGPVSTKRELATEYRKMPLLNGPNAIVDAVRVNGINFMIGANFASAAVGQFGMAWRILQAPMALINAAVAQVFYQRLASVRRGTMLTIVRKAIVRSVVLGAVPFALIYLLAPWGIPFLLGQQWRLAGQIAQILVPWLFMNFITSPISTVFVVVRRQFTMLMYAIAFMIVPLAAIARWHVDILSTMGIVSWSMAGMLGIFLLLTLLVSWQYDRGFGYRPGEDAENDTDEDGTPDAVEVDQADEVVHE